MSHLSEEQLDHLIDQERTRVQAPLNDWRTIAARAREEGLIRGSVEASSWRSSRPWMQAAAAIVLLAGGVAIGRTTAAPPGSANVDQVAEQSAPASAGVASNSGAVTQVGGTTFASVDEASATLERALSDYQRASAFIAANVSGPTTMDSSRIYSARLAALDQVGDAMEGALRTAPHDPVINQYYLATMGARVATQQLAARPVGLRLKGF
jgi:hypothetical protein